MDGKYIRFHVIGKKPKTKFYGVYTLQDEQIGTIQWYGRWRQYCFFPNKDTVWSNGCLQDVQNFIYQITKEQKETAVKPIPPPSKDGGILGVIL